MKFLTATCLIAGLMGITTSTIIPVRFIEEDITGSAKDANIEDGTKVEEVQKNIEENENDLANVVKLEEKLQ